MKETVNRAAGNNLCRASERKMERGEWSGENGARGREGVDEGIVEQKKACGLGSESRPGSES